MLEQRIADRGAMIRIGENRIYQDGDIFIVEKFAFRVAHGRKVYTYYNEYDDLEVAVGVAKRI